MSDPSVLLENVHSQEAVYLPREVGGPAFFFWSPEEPSGAHDVELVVPEEDGLGRAPVTGCRLELMSSLVYMLAADHDRTVGWWSRAARFALDLVQRRRCLPRLDKQKDGAVHAVWGATFGFHDRDVLGSLVSSAPVAAHCLPWGEDQIWSPLLLLSRFIDDVVDHVMRMSASLEDDWGDESWLDSLFRPDPTVDIEDVERFNSWAVQTPILEGEFGMVLVPPQREAGPWNLNFLLYTMGCSIPAQDVWRFLRGMRGSAHLLVPGGLIKSPARLLRHGLTQAVTAYPSLRAVLKDQNPTGFKLDERGVLGVLKARERLEQFNVPLQVPREMSDSRLNLKMRLTSEEAQDEFLGGAVHFVYEVALGDEVLTKEEFQELLNHGGGLIRYNNRWVALFPSELAEAQKALELGEGVLNPMQAMEVMSTGRMAGGPNWGADIIDVEIRASGNLEDFRTRIIGSSHNPIKEPPGFQGVLRPYQQGGVGWLTAMDRLGLGGCLADDMGLGKTIQVIGHLLQMHNERLAQKERGILAVVICPTSVVGNWRREINRFGPKINVILHHGPGRSRTTEDLQVQLMEESILWHGVERHVGGAGVVVVTSFGTARRDREVLSEIHWTHVIADEAQNIKTPGTDVSQALRAIPASQKLALTGTPLENRLLDLWSILDFTNPGLLGSQKKFTEMFALPIEKDHNSQLAQHLSQLVRPFLLRRLKSDPNVALDLPEKEELRVECPLTEEQATLYGQTVANALSDIESHEGMARRGRILALLTALKQICNHPINYLKAKGGGTTLPGRSGKLTRLTELLEEVLACSEQALIFTQFKEMGEILVSHLKEALQIDVAFLHGGTPRKKRDEMIDDFNAGVPPIMVLSLKAGGTGLNLIGANHVFHFDRWWNPAVEDQATDRAHRIGQTRRVMVHKFISTDTLEERIDDLLEKKRDLSDAVVGSGENWITELSDDQLRDLVALGVDAANPFSEDTAEAAP